MGRAVATNAERQATGREQAQWIRERHEQIHVECLKAPRDYGLRDRRGQQRLTVGADKGYDTRDFVAGCRELKITPHVAQNVSGRRSAIDERTAAQPGYVVSQRLRKRVEEIFGWVKTVGGGRKAREGIACRPSISRSGRR